MGGTKYSAMDGPVGLLLEGTKYSAMDGPGGTLLWGTTYSMTGLFCCGLCSMYFELPWLCKCETL